METHVPPALYSVDLGGCADLADRAPDEIMATFCAALRRAGATVVQELSHSFPETGLTCVLILSESHAVLHTWPETGTVNIDIFSCSTRLKSLDAIDELRRSFGAATCHRPGDPPCRRTRPAVGRTRLSSRCAAVAWSLGLFGLLRLSWIEAHVVLPLTRVQAGVAAGLFGTPALAGRGHAGVQRGRRVGAVPRRPSSPTRCRGERASPGLPAAPR